uniref:Uncharacterized protein n=1 Tax=Avena sativa TaxID=4498 RepID=A0ACD5YRR2_AVESA
MISHVPFLFGPFLISTSKFQRTENKINTHPAKISMGAKLSSCFNHVGSLSQQADQPAPVRVIAADSSLKELPASLRVAVSDILGGKAAPFVVCSSDELYFNEPPSALAADELLQPGHIYFLLPAAVLAQPRQHGLSCRARERGARG